MNKKVVVALGGNALGKTPLEQKTKGREIASTIADLIELGYDVAITHGNGPQVGMVNLAFEEAHNRNREVPNMPFPESGSMTQGYIGYHLQQALKNELIERGINKNTVSLITQILVDRNDPSFLNPSKPIGLNYNKLMVNTLKAENGYHFIEEVGKGYRRVIASPVPKKIVEIDIINSILDSHNIPITVGGGGIPVILDGNKYKGIDAVIDKDAAAGRLAIDINADMLIILTGKDKVLLNYKKENEEVIDELTLEKAIKLLEDNQFEEGSMKPKIEACVNYLKEVPSGIALITSLEKAKEAIYSSEGTVIKN